MGLNDKKVNTTSVTGLYDPLESLRDPLNTIMSGGNGLAEYYKFIQDQYGITPESYEGLSEMAKINMLNNAKNDGFSGGDWFGVNGLNTKSLTEGINTIGGLASLYTNIAGIGQRNKLFDKQMNLLDQKYNTNQYLLDNDKKSKAAFADATSNVFNTGGSLAAGSYL